MKKIDINTGLKLSIIFGILLISGSIFYRFVILIPSGERQVEARKQQKEGELFRNRMFLFTCLAGERDGYESRWAMECQRLGEDARNCSLPAEIADRLNKDLDRNRNECYRNYPTK